MTKKIRYGLLALLLVILLTGTGCLLFWDTPCSMYYTISQPAIKPNTLQVVLDVSRPILSKSKTLSLYTADKAITLKSCTDQAGLSSPMNVLDDSVELPVGRGQTRTLIYEIELGASGKHGKRGYSTNRFCVFDGGQAFLLPSELYEPNFPTHKAVVDTLTISLNAREGWTEILPYSRLKQVTWADAYDLNNNSFAMGAFTEHTLAGEMMPHVYTLSESAELPQDIQSGVAALYQYYSDLFSAVNQPYQIILLPPSEDGLSVIGGAGKDSVCATFDAKNKRDWELLSHRMFHSRFDTVFRTKMFHEAPQLWFYEGLATYYENLSMAQMPSSLREKTGIQPKQQFTSLFNKYLYIKLKDPALFSLAPMNEEKILESEAQTEFLHYIQAPLVVRLMEDTATLQTGQKHNILSYLLQNRGNPAMLSYEQILPQVLGEEAARFWQSYFLSDEILPLWYLRDSAYTEQQTLNDLNEIEILLASWMKSALGEYPCESVNLETVRKIRSAPEFAVIHYADDATEQAAYAYSPAIHELMKEYALRADICGIDFKDSMLRYSLYGDEKNIAVWNDWIIKQNEPASEK